MREQLDTSGTVLGVFDRELMKRDGCWTWDGMNNFMQGYISAALLAETGLSGVPLWQNKAFSDFAPQALKLADENCTRFQRLTPGANDQDMGAMFWNDQQAGRWERVCFPPIAVYVGEDGLIYFREAGQ
ncbi:MAG: hypothetical protein KKA05_10415 [Alphaproteobacteria bacterium]|nr:hypothetical protein [Alphaproteobacteria bacterium]